ncbi:type II toxin-antitoxin system RelE/ParE family toxin [uncultured Roseibium sp.]|uniref:type II toxin-antitoxin system RelE/ParE family toxin n=1 Tax=uncultured Roseibium sp. TaxID=1936171 RepID=UPI00263A3ABC|nr:type II toxin-antitoxin system RelE/ParE family toxin [uncultured Roseibium sp.]
MPRKYRLKLSASADRDLTAIYDYGFIQWGEERADLYYDALIDHLDQLCDNPFLYAAVDDIRPGYRRSIFRAHTVYYKVNDTAVEIMAVIGRQDF